MEAPAGVLCALVTPFKADGTPYLGALAELVEFQVQGGAAGLFVLGTTGEGVLLDASERRRLAERLAGLVGGRLPLVVHCGAADTPTTAALAGHAEGLGAPAVASVVPYFFRYGPDALYRHFATVAEAAPAVGDYVYDNPSGWATPAGSSWSPAWSPRSRPSAGSRTPATASASSASTWPWAARPSRCTPAVT